MDNYSDSSENSPRLRAPGSPSLARNLSSALELSIPNRKSRIYKSFSGQLRLGHQNSSIILSSPLTRSFSYVPGKSVSITLGVSEDEEVAEDEDDDQDGTQQYPEPETLTLNSLPPRCIIAILSFSVSSLSDWLPVKLVCKKWRHLANVALRSLRISHRAPLVAAGFPAALATFSSLKSLQISLPMGSNGGMTDGTLMSIATACPGLASLHLSFWEASGEALEAAPAFASVTDFGLDILFQHCSLLEELTLAVHASSHTTSPEIFFPLPDSLGDLIKLRSLALHSRQVSSLPSTVGNLESLLELSVSCPEISSLPETLGDLKNVVSIDLSSCKSLETIPGTLSTIPCLTSLILRGCHSLRTFSYVSPFKSLTFLDLSECRGLETLPEALNELFPALNEFNLRGCVSLEELPESLSCLKGLRSLNFDGCLFDRVPESLSGLTRLNKRDKAKILEYLVPRTVSPPPLER